MGHTRPCAWRTVRHLQRRSGRLTLRSLGMISIPRMRYLLPERSRSGARYLGQAGSASTARSRRGDTPSLAATSVRGRSGSASMIWRASRRVTVVGRRPESPSGLPIRGTEPTEVLRRSVPTERARDRSGPTGRTTAVAAGRSMQDVRRPGGTSSVRGTSSSCGTWTGSGTSTAGGTSSRGGTCAAGGIPFRSGTWVSCGVCGAAGTSSRSGTCASASCLEVAGCWASGTRHGRGTWAAAGT
jgi:hypothetical protein